MVDVPPNDEQNREQEIEETNERKGSEKVVEKEQTQGDEIEKDSEKGRVEKDNEKEEAQEKEFDIEEFKRSTVAETQKAILEKLMEGLGMTKTEKEAAKDELIPPWEKRGEDRPRSWKEHAEYAAELAQWKRKREEEEIARIQEENEKEAKEQAKKWNDYWDSELSEMEASGDFPKVNDPNNPNDPGKQARVRLFAKMREVGLQRQKEGKAPITSAELIFRKYRDEILAEPAGANAPISMGKQGVSSEDEDPGYSYEEIHGSSFDQLKSK